MLCGPMDCVRMLIEQAWNKGDLEIVDQLYSPHCIQYDITTGVAEYMGSKGQRRLIEAMRVAFPDLDVKIDEIIGAGHRVICRLTISGTHRGQWLGVEPSNRHISWGAIVIYRFVSNKIQEKYVSQDSLAALRQMGGLSIEKRAAA